MIAIQLLEALKSKGLIIKEKNGDLQVCPASLLTEEDRTGIRANKAELLKLLSLPPGPLAGSAIRPLSVRASIKLDQCLWDSCDGELLVRGEFWICSDCQTWYKHSGPLSELDQYCLNERASICEFEAGMSREEAESIVAGEFLSRHRMALNSD